MCVERSRAWVNGDRNIVSVSGTMEGPSSFFIRKGTPTFRFMLRSMKSQQSIHKFQVRARGQLAYDLLMYYMRDREIEVDGRLRSRAKGRVEIAVNTFCRMDAPRAFVPDDLMEKIQILNEAGIDETFTGKEDMAETIYQEEEDDSMLFEDVIGEDEDSLESSILDDEGRPEGEEKPEPESQEDKHRKMCLDYYQSDMDKGTAAATLFNEDGTILIEEANEIVDKWYAFFEEVDKKTANPDGHPAQGGLSQI